MELLACSILLASILLLPATTRALPDGAPVCHFGVAPGAAHRMGFAPWFISGSLDEGEVTVTINGCEVTKDEVFEVDVFEPLLVTITGETAFKGVLARFDVEEAVGLLEDEMELQISPACTFAGVCACMNGSLSLCTPVRTLTFVFILKTTTTTTHDRWLVSHTLAEWKSTKFPLSLYSWKKLWMWTLPWTLSKEMTRLDPSFSTTSSKLVPFSRIRRPRVAKGAGAPTAKVERVERKGIGERRTSLQALREAVVVVMVPNGRRTSKDHACGVLPLLSMQLTATLSHSTTRSAPTNSCI